MIIAQKDNITLRLTRVEDFPVIDEITILCYGPIHDSWVEMLGEDVYYGTRSNPDENWEDNKNAQNHDRFDENPEWIWTLENEDKIIGYVSFKLVSGSNLGIIENNGVIPEERGKGWGKFMYRHVLKYMKEQGIGYALVETGLDDVHIPARRAYEAVGFDRQAPIVLYWQDLSKNNFDSAHHH